MASASWSIPALADEVARVRHVTARFARDHGVPDNRVQDLGLAVSEAVSNAAVHAFRAREYPGTVRVSITITRDEFVELVVSDDGMGMSPRDDSPGLGLGLGIISSLADQIEHRRPADGLGFELLMRFRFDAA